MSDEDIDDLNEHIALAVQRELDGRMRKLFWAIWSMIIGGASSLIFLGVQWGSLKTTVTNHVEDSNLHMSANDKFQTFVTRTEWVTQLSHHNTVLAEIKDAVKANGEKIDKLRFPNP